MAHQTMMATPANLNWDDVTATVNHAIHLLETVGPTAIGLVKTIMLGVQAATGRDLLGVFAALNSAQRDVQVIVAAIKTEFVLS